MKNKQDRDSDDNEKIINIENKYKGKPYELFNILRGNSSADLKEPDTKYLNISDDQKGWS